MTRTQKFNNTTLNKIFGGTDTAPTGPLRPPNTAVVSNPSTQDPPPTATTATTNKPTDTSPSPSLSPISPTTAPTNPTQPSTTAAPTPKTVLVPFHKQLQKLQLKSLHCQSEHVLLEHSIK